MFGREQRFGFTESEDLWDKVSYARLLEFLHKPDTKIMEFERESNSYGEFRFITLERVGGQFTFYGHGYDELREEHLAFSWQFYRHPNPSNVRTEQSKPRIVQQLRFEHDTYKMKAGKPKQKSARAELYSTLVDGLGDPDSIATMLY